MRDHHRLILAAVLVLLATAAFAQQPATPQTAGEHAMTAKEQAKAEAARVAGLLTAPNKHTWIRRSPEGLAMLTFDPSGKFEGLVMIQRTSLMPRGAQSQCTGEWSVSGNQLTISHRVCTTGQTREEPTPDGTGEILKLDDKTLTLKLDDGGTFTFEAQP